jgi:hypothetical protein
MQNLIPNKSAMLQHLQFLFTELDDYKDGFIEIAYTPNNSGAVNKAEYFDIYSLEKAADFAFNKNKENGVNVYVGAALREPNTAPFCRSSADDFYVSTAIWVDLDDPDAARTAKEKYSSLPPSLIVVTGRSPNLRAQCWWHIMHPEDNKTYLNNALAFACSALNGDKAVVDPARVMRLGGTIAWPKKEGRIPELTEVVIPEKNTKMVLIDHFESYFPNVKPALLTESKGIAFGGVGRDIFTNTINIPVLLEQTKIEGQWHINMRDAIAAMIGKGWTNEQIKIATNPYRRDRSLIDDMITPLITSARKKWEKPDLKDMEYNPETGEITPLEATDIADIDLDNIPPRAWLFGDIVARKYVTMIAASPGAGKSVFTMQMGLCASSGKNFGPYTPHEKSIKTWVYNNEEGQEEMRRRAAAMLICEKIQKADIAGKFFMNSGEDNSICIAKKNIDGGVVHTPDYLYLKQEILKKGIDLLVVDPFAETHDVNENSNDEIKTVAGLYRKLALECNCAVLLVHHTRKGGNSKDKSSEANSNADSARGGGAQIGVVRRMFTLAKMDSGTAVKFNIPENERYWFVRFDDAKTNITAPTQDAQWFKFDSIALNNGTGIYTDGDKVGVLVHKNKDEMMQSAVDTLKDERTSMLYRITNLMMIHGHHEIGFSPLIQIVINSGYAKYKDRALRKFIQETLEEKMFGQPVICQGFKCILKFIPAESKTIGHKIILQKEEVE